MARKRKTQFKLNPEWMFQEPIDFEFNKYTLLDYIQKCEQSFDSFKIGSFQQTYPFHYVEKDWMSKQKIKQMEEAIGK